MAVVIAVTKEESLSSTILLVGTLTFSGSYASPGEGLDFSGLTKATKAPFFIWVKGQAGYFYEGIEGATIANGSVAVRESAAATNPLAEIPDAAYPAGVIGDTVGFIALFPKFV